MTTMPWLTGMANSGFGGTSHSKQIFSNGKSAQPKNGFIQHNDHVDGGHLVGFPQDRKFSSSKTSEAAVQTSILNGNCADKVPEIIIAISKETAVDVVHHGAQTRNTKPCSKFAKTMRRTVTEISERHNILFGSMVNKLQITEENAEVLFNSVLDEIFVDGQINWGRVVAVYAFGARLAEYGINNGMSPDFVDRIAGYVGIYVSTKLGVWIDENGGWDAFCDFFPEKETLEDKMWRGLVFTAVGLGAGALATFMAAKTS